MTATSRPDGGSPIAFVTGASRGIGRAIALDLARHGYDLVLFARSYDTSAEDYSGTLVETAEQVRAFGRAALPIAMDMAVLDSVKDGLARALGECDRVDVLVTAANIVDFTPGGTYLSGFMDTRWDAIERHLTLNCVSTPLMIHTVVPYMAQRGEGLIANITQHKHGSLEKARNRGPMPGQGASGFAVPVSRGVTDRLAPTLARELEPHGVTIVTLDPGMTLSIDEHRLEAVERAGYRRDMAHSIAVPARALTHLALSAERARYAGELISAVEYVREHSLLTEDEIARPWDQGVADVRELAPIAR